MNKLIRVFSYILMILGAVIVLGGMGTGIIMLVTRGARMMEHSQPFFRMMGEGAAVTTALKVMLQGLLVSGFGMLLYLVGEIVKNSGPDMEELPIKSTRIKK